MTLDYVLRKSLGRDPHCFRAFPAALQVWVEGKGYINDGLPVEEREEFLRQYHRAALSEIENMGYAPHYAESGYDQNQPKNGVLLANWNNLAKGLDRILERMGYEMEWSDEWTTCDDCNGAVRIEPDSYVWEPSYKMIDDDTLLCLKCAEEEED